MVSHTRHIALIAGLHLLTVPIVFAKDWVAYTSESHSVLTDASEDRALDFLEKLEFFRSTILPVLGLSDEIDDERLTIVMFANGREFDALSPSRTSRTGYAYNNIYGSRIIVRSGTRPDQTQRFIFYAYVLSLIDRHSSVSFPRWYRVGLALLVSTIQFSEKSIHLGAQPTPFFPDPNVLAALDGEDVGSFSPTALLMTHYFLFGLSDAPNRRQQLLEYLRRFDAGEDSIAAFTESFGISPSDMEGELKLYRRRGLITGLEIPRVEYSGKLLSRPLAQGEVLHLLGDIAVEMSETAAAHQYFDAFAELGADSPFRAKVTASRAIAYLHEQRIDQGDVLMEQLLSLSGSDPDVWAEIAHYAFDRYIHDRDNGGDGLDYLSQAIEFGERAVVADAANLQAIYFLGRAHEERGDLEAAGDMMRRAYDIDSSISGLNMAFTRVLLKLGDVDSALYVISRQHGAVSSERRQFLRRLQQSIEDGTFDIVEIEATH